MSAAYAWVSRPLGALLQEEYCYRGFLEVGEPASDAEAGEKPEESCGEELTEGAAEKTLLNDTAE